MVWASESGEGLAAIEVFDVVVVEGVLEVQVIIPDLSATFGAVVVVLGAEKELCTSGWCGEVAPRCAPKGAHEVRAHRRYQAELDCFG